MPPVFGPLVVVADPLEVLGRAQRHDRLAVAEAEQRDLRPVEELLDDDPSARPWRGRPARGRAPRRGRSVTTTPLPAARPSSLTTCGRAQRVERVDSTSPMVVHTWARAVGTSAAAMTSLANALLPSSRAASADGPKTGDARRRAPRPPPPRPAGPPGRPRRGRRRARRASAAMPSPSSRPPGQRLAQGEGVHARVAGGGDDRVDLLVGGQCPDDGVLASTGADDENLHGPSVENSPKIKCAASRGGRGDISRGRRAADVRSPGGGTCNQARGSTVSTGQQWTKVGAEVKPLRGGLPSLTGSRQGRTMGSTAHRTDESAGRHWLTARTPDARSHDGRLPTDPLQPTTRGPLAPRPGDPDARRRSGHPATTTTRPRRRSPASTSRSSSTPSPPGPCSSPRACRADLVDESLRWLAGEGLVRLHEGGHRGAPPGHLPARPRRRPRAAGARHPLRGPRARPGRTSRPASHIAPPDTAAVRILQSMDELAAATRRSDRSRRPSRSAASGPCRRAPATSSPPAPQPRGAQHRGRRGAARDDDRLRHRGPRPRQRPGGPRGTRARRGAVPLHHRDPVLGA